MAAQLNKPLMKTFKEPRTEFDWLSTDEKQVDKYIKDPFCGHQYSAKFYIEFFSGLVKANKTIILEETRNIPILFISGKDDPVGEFGDGVDDVREFYNGHGFFLLTIKLIEGMRHEVLNEKKKTTTYKIVEEWVQSIL